MQSYEIAPNSRVCCVSGRPLRPGDVYYSVVLDTVTGLVRRDYAAAEWTGPPEGAIGFWRGTIPETVQAPKRGPVPVERMLAFFDEMGEPTEPERQPLRYVLALLLLRRKALRLQGMESGHDSEQMVLEHVRTKKSYRVSDQQLSDEQIAALEAELAEVLSTDEP